MGEIEIVEEMPLTLAEVRDKLEALKKSQELSFRAKKASEYLGKFAKETQKEIKAAKEKLQGLDIVRLKDKHIVKILDLHPEDLESLKVILSAENISIKPEDLQKVLECVK